VPEQEKALPVSSSIPPQFPVEQEDLFREVLMCLNRLEVPYVISGAFALQQHTGIWRDTKDLDLFLPADAVPQALAALRSDGFDCEICDEVWLAKAHRGDFFVDLITGMSNAVITVDQAWIDRASRTDIFGIPVRVLAPEELIASKLFVTRRERFDGADIAHVIYGTQGRLDWNRLLHIVGEHWEVLFWALTLFHYVYPSKADYVPRQLWDDFLQRFKTEIDHPDPKAEFRGSLIDDKMFAIDVAEWGMENLLDDYRDRRRPKLKEVVTCESQHCDPSVRKIT
jgi:hypothetical protein